MQAEQHVGLGSKVERDQIVHKGAGQLKVRGGRNPGRQTQRAEENKNKQVEVVLGGAVAAQAFIGPTAQHQADAAHDDAQRAGKSTGADDITHKDHQAALRVKAQKLRNGRAQHYDGSAHEHVHAHMEGIGTHPQFEVVLKSGMQKKHFGQQSLHIAHVLNMPGLGPPVLFFHKAAAVHRLGAFVRHWVQFPPNVQRAGCEVGFDFKVGHAEKAGYRQIAKNVKKCGHSFTPVGSRCR